jgi:hypothetical protein
VLAGSWVVVLALAVDRHRRRDDEPTHTVAARDELLEQRGAADRVDLDVAADLVHRLADANGGGEVHDRIGSIHRAAKRCLVAHVADD